MPSGAPEAVQPERSVVVGDRRDRGGLARPGVGGTVQRRDPVEHGFGLRGGRLDSGGRVVLVRGG
ncbi:hypothetical protein EGX94_11025 [Propionibacterium acidifaciens]|nr:hypothetical protein EGX94_11025 [Propionibacterium acidifaciens]